MTWHRIFAFGTVNFLINKGIADFKQNVFTKGLKINGVIAENITGTTIFGCNMRCTDEERCLGCLYKDDSVCSLIYSTNNLAENIHFEEGNGIVFVKETNPLSTVSCPENFTLTSAGCFLVETTEELTWEGAMNRCQEYGENVMLSSLETSEKRTVVTSLTENDSYMWVGVWDENDTDVFTFVYSGAQVPSDMWAPDEPLHFWHGGATNCACLIHGKLLTDFCDDETWMYDYVCEAYPEP